MKNPGKLFGWCVLFCTLLVHSAQAQKLWSEVRVNKSAVYLGEPVEVTVSVYTSTWFTAGVDPGNIKVDGAYTVFFRNVSTSKTVNGKTIAGVDMIFNVFPNSVSDITFPQLEIEVESPADGDYKGRRHTVKTKLRKISVKPIPPGFAADEWLVTNSLSVRQNWSGNLKNVKVGDVITRTITRNASNTVSQLLPGVAWDSVAGVSQYPYRSNVESHRSKTAISATRTETMRYLFEKEGEVILPQMEFTYWNPYHQKLYKRTLKEVKIDVQPNPDLGMLASIRDSLNAQVAATQAAQAESEKPFTILGMSVKKFATLVGSIILLLIALVLLLKWGINYRKNYLKKYRNSELYYWRKFVRAVRSKKRDKTINCLYAWLDKLHLSEPTATYFAAQFGNKNLQKELENLESDLTKNSSVTINISAWKHARKNYLSNATKTVKKINWINP